MPAARGMKACDRTRVGVVVPCPESADRFLVSGRDAAPFGLSFPGGHVGDHGGSVEVTGERVLEEVGMTASKLVPVAEFWLPDRCGRPGPEPCGHQWSVWRAEGFSGRESGGARWVTLDEVRAEIRRTLDYGWGIVTEEEFGERPGMGAAWCLVLHEIGMVRIGSVEEDLLRELCGRA